MTGTFGIPAFLLVNGYLRSKRTIDLSLTWRCTVRYLLFDLIWSCIISILHAVSTRRFELFEIFYGAIIGKGALYHLWFLTALMIIYLLITVTIKSLGKSRFNKNVEHRYFLAGVVILMMLSFVGNILLKLMINIEVRDVIAPPFRIITNGGYFLIGMHLGRLNKQQSLIGMKQYLTMMVLLLSTLLIWICAEITGMVYASSYYASVPVVVGTIVLFCRLRGRLSNCKFSSLAKSIINTSTGIWVLHPFVLSAVRKALSVIAINETFIVSVVVLLLTILISGMASLTLTRIKFLKKLISP